MIVKTTEDQKRTFPTFFLADRELSVVDEVKYLGHIIRDDLSDDDDIQRQCCLFFMFYMDYF